MKQIAKDLLSIKAVELSPAKPFTWASGLKSPIYCDNRLTISYPEIRTRIAQGIAAQIKDRYPDAEVIAGTATAGIPHAAWVAAELNLPLVYVRSKPKVQELVLGLNAHEGVLPNGAKTVVIDDLLSTGGSVLKAVTAAQNEGAQVIGAAGIFSYQLPQLDANFQEAGIPYTTITNYTELLDAAVEENYVTAEDRAVLADWRQDPQAWGARFKD